MPLVLMGRPKLKHIPNIPAEVIVTLLGENEDAKSIVKTVKRCPGKESIWLPIYNIGRRNATHDQVTAVRELACRLARRLADGERIAIHCAAGIHRTGLVAYWTLRETGMTHDEALKEIERLRPVTAAGCAAFLGDYARS